MANMVSFGFVRQHVTDRQVCLTILTHSCTGSSFWRKESGWVLNIIRKTRG